ncbi:hypothetical protein [Baekduia sp. Peel2402]|uniref:hypothetical protein n=1 Tax=Baekduia sp. Peel2402 TaxID=3458296 RepID=UPI00403ECE13
MRAPFTAALASLLAAIVAAVPAHAADGPAPTASCTGAPQITDASGDGHHTTTDVLSAWLTEGAGRLQAVVQVRSGAFAPEHGDAEVNGSGFAMVFTVGGATGYVRTRAAPDGSLTYDYGTYANGAFTSAGATTGSVVHSAGAGTTTIDVPVAALGIVAGTVLNGPYVLTYDGISGGVPDWVDHAPGGVDPSDSARGADYTVSACGGAGGGTGTGGGGGAGGTGTGAGSGTSATTAVVLSAPTKRTGSGRVLVTGRVIPARVGIAVAIARKTRAGTKTAHVTTDADGEFALTVALSETTDLRATVGGIRSATRTVTLRSRTTVRVRRSRAGTVTLTGTVSPAVPGRALLLEVGSPDTTASRAVSNGRFTFRFKKGHVPRGRFQIVFVPSKERAERSTSRAVRLG